MKYSCLAALLFSVSFAVFARDPLGERASYKLDRSSTRTSSTVRDGKSLGTVTEKIVGNDASISYDVKIDYDLDVFLAGRRTGSEIFRFPAAYFTEEFFVELRKKKYYEDANMKMRHEGFSDARTMDGKVYPNCDKLYIYDIKRPERMAFFDLAEMISHSMHDLGWVQDSDLADDMVVRAHVFYGVPVLGGVKLDITGTMSGFKIKTGFDYIAPR